MNSRLLLMPESAYDTLMESLQLDAMSSCVEPKLRLQIQKSLEKIRELPCPYTVIVHVRSGVAEVGRCPEWLNVKIEDHDNH